MLVAGGETKIVQVFDLGSRAILRAYAGHTRAVHRTLFSPGGHGVYSFSDDWMSPDTMSRIAKLFVLFGFWIFIL